MDVVAKFPGSNRQFMVDITIRAPFATSYGDTHICAGLACAAGEHAKFTRYGTEVAPLAFESFGRLGKPSGETLVALAMEVELWSFGKVSANHLAADWQAALELTLAWELADAAMQSLGRAPGLFAGL